MTPRSIRRAAERKANKAARRAASSLPFNPSKFGPSAVVGRAPSPACDLQGRTTSRSPRTRRPFPSLSEITPARLAANRENAQKSSGPKTEVGKSVSSQNRTTHGLARHNGRFALLPTEYAGEFAQLLDDFTEEHQPATAAEISLVHTMAESLWLHNRAQNLQITCFDPTTGLVANEKSLSLYLRYENTYNRAFNSSLNQLLRIRAEKRKAELGFEVLNGSHFPLESILIHRKKVSV